MTNTDKDDHAGNAGVAGGKHDKKKPRKFSQYHGGNRNRQYNNFYGKTREYFLNYFQIFDDS